jgi:hypothetical protein
MITQFVYWQNRTFVETGETKIKKARHGMVSFEISRFMILI